MSFRAGTSAEPRTRGHCDRAARALPCHLRRVAMLLAFGIDDDAREAFDALGATLAKNGTAFGARVGYRGGFVDTQVTWHRSVGMWSLLDSKQADRRFWCCFGVDDPRKATALDIAVEINPRHQGNGSDRRRRVRKGREGRRSLVSQREDRWWAQRRRQIGVFPPLLRRWWFGIYAPSGETGRRGGT